jgi:RNA polymerase sigma factor (sigma-70 family)
MKVGWFRLGTLIGCRISRSAPAGRLPDVSKAPFERIVDAHGRTVLRVCRALLSPADADDAWAETFLAALRAYPELPADANVEAWLVTIAHRKAIDVVRAQGRRAIPVADAPDAPSALGNPREPADELWAAVRALPDRQRHAVAYHHVAGLPHREVAQILGGTPEAARRAAADGIKAIRRRLADQEEAAV